MENQERLPEEKVNNIEPSRVGPNPADDHLPASGYTSGETEYADGEGTRLAQETEEKETDEQGNNDLHAHDASPEPDVEDAAFENPDDDPA